MLALCKDQFGLKKKSKYSQEARGKNDAKTAVKKREPRQCQTAENQ